MSLAIAIVLPEHSSVMSHHIVIAVRFLNHKNGKSRFEHFPKFIVDADNRPEGAFKILEDNIRYNQDRLLFEGYLKEILLNLKLTVVLAVTNAALVLLLRKTCLALGVDEMSI